MLFRKTHLVILRHLKFKNLVRTFCINDLNKLKSFIKYYYPLENFKIEIKLNTKKMSITDVIDIYNSNPFRDNIDSSEYTLYSPSEFLDKYDLNNYELTYTEHKNNWSVDEGHYIILNSDQENGDTLVFDNFSEFYSTLRQIKNSGMVHKYSLNELNVSLDDYVKVLQLYGEFHCDISIKNSKDLNQWISDARILELVDVQNIIEEDTPNKYEIDDDY